MNPEDGFDPIPPSLLRKYIAYARKYAQPVLTGEAAKVLQDFYLNLRLKVKWKKYAKRDEKTPHNDPFSTTTIPFFKYRSSDAIPITTRQLESMVRLAEARARADLREYVVKEDAEEVVEIMRHSLWESYEDEFGNVDLHRSQHGKEGTRKIFFCMVV